MIQLGSPVIKEALLHFGHGSQTYKALEEFSELQRAIAKNLMREPNATHHVIDEIADCFIMLEQLAHIYGINEVTAQHAFKLARLQARIEEMKE